MDDNRELIEQFYTAFQNKNAEVMASSYASDARFSDPVFTDLNGVEIGAMWKMLVEKSTDLQIEFANVQADDHSGRADWVATYPFAKTGRLIRNRIHADFTFENGKIKTHRDSFSLWKWAGMALGMKGYLFGWSSSVQEQIRKEASTGLKMYMKRKKIG